MMKKIVLILFSLFFLESFAQNEGYLILEQDQRIDQLLSKQKEIHAADNTIDGYRIQIFMESGNDAVDHAQKVMEEFTQNHPEIPIYLIFGQPYYRLRVGDFRTRLDAEKVFLLLNKEYKNAFITAERINLPINIFCDSNMDGKDIENIDNESFIDSIYYYDE